MFDAVQHLRVAFRVLRKSPVFALTATSPIGSVAFSWWARLPLSCLLFLVAMLFARSLQEADESIRASTQPALMWCRSTSRWVATVEAMQSGLDRNWWSAHSSFREWRPRRCRA